MAHRDPLEGARAPATRHGDPQREPWDPQRERWGPQQEALKQSTTNPGDAPDSGVAPGYVRSDDPAGFSVDVPSGWERTAKTPQDKPTVVMYESPDGSRTLQLFLISEDTPAESMDLTEDENYGFARLPGYRVLARSAADGHLLRGRLPLRR